uniref:Uncharacterized protein n=1 Tax=Rhizophora mucronata TaxID=61149 RepID=A0A2P2NY17_RHIMU
MDQESEPALFVFFGSAILELETEFLCRIL